MSEQSQTFAPPPGPAAGRPAGPAGPLQRSRSDRKVAGVCGGLATYFGIDPIILRILIVVLSLFGGSGLLIYAAGWLLLPDEGQQRSEIQKLLDRDGQRKSPKVVLLAAIIIIALLWASMGTVLLPKAQVMQLPVIMLIALLTTGSVAYFAPHRTLCGYTAVISLVPSPLL